MKPQVSFLFILALIEGSSVMVCELLGAKLIAPYFGGSLYVWSSVLGVTLSALMIGYYLGGILSSRVKSHFVYWVLLIAGILLVMMPNIAFRVMSSIIESQDNISIQFASITSLMVFLFPQLVLYGMTSPLIINELNTNKNKAGKISGSVYAISTLGGIFATFLMGFYLLPTYGIRFPALVFGLLLIVFSIFGFFLHKKIVLGFITTVVTLLIVISAISVEESDSRKFKVQYQSDGILGQIKVIDQRFNSADGLGNTGRVLYVNNIAQTIMNLDDPEYSLWEWAYYFPAAASVFPENSDALLLGLGGGTLAKQFQRLKFNVDIVEIDERVKDVAFDFFYVDRKTNVIIDDGRHFINSTKKSYDLITLDVFISESPPSHLISVESFKKMKERLKPGGMVMMNFYGYLMGDIGRSGRSVFKTFNEAGFDTKLFVTPGSEAGRNLILLACTEAKDFTNCTYTEPGRAVLGDITNYFIDPLSLHMSDAIVLTDKTPILEKMYIDCSLDWRMNAINTATKKFIKEGIK